MPCVSTYQTDDGCCCWYLLLEREVILQYAQETLQFIASKHSLLACFPAQRAKIRDKEIFGLTSGITTCNKFDKWCSQKYNVAMSLNDGTLN